MKGQSICTMLKEFRGCECGFATHRMRGYGSFSRRPHALFATLGAAGLSLLLIIPDTDCDGVVVAFTLSVFSSIFVPGS